MALQGTAEMQRQHPKTELAAHITADLLRRRLGSECVDRLKARLSQRYRSFAIAFALRALDLSLPARGPHRGIVCGSLASTPRPKFRCCPRRCETRKNTLSRFEFGKLLDQFQSVCIDPSQAFGQAFSVGANIVYSRHLLPRLYRVPLRHCICTGVGRTQFMVRSCTDYP